jgi:hypothetical protein
MNGAADPLVVRSERLAELLLPVIHAYTEIKEAARTTKDPEDRWSKAAMSTKGLHESRMSDFAMFPSGMQVVAELIGIDRQALHRTLFQSDWVGLGKADAMLQALGMTQEAQELRPVANPFWSQEKWEGWAAENGYRSCYFEGGSVEEAGLELTEAEFKWKRGKLNNRWGS